MTKKISDERVRELDQRILRLVVALVLSSLGFVLWWVRVIRAGLAWRELRITIY